MNHFEKVFSCLPAVIQSRFNSLDQYTKSSIEEIRIYKNKEIQIFSGNRRMSFPGKIQGNDLKNILNNLMKFSYYAYEEDLKKGFITIDGGHRVGICGKAVIENGKVELIRDVSSINIRYSKEIIGCSDKIINFILDSKTRNPVNVLIVSPPGCGKTTLLRDICRNIGFKGYKVGICDERSEIAGMYNGISSYSFGELTDILDGCPKDKGLIMLVRAMSPDVIVTDEIGTEEDVNAIRLCTGCGVKIITSIHGSNLDDLRKSPIYCLIEDKSFNTIIFLSNNPQVGTVREVLHD